MENETQHDSLDDINPSILDPMWSHYSALAAIPANMNRNIEVYEEATTPLPDDISISPDTNYNAFPDFAVDHKNINLTMISCIPPMASGPPVRTLMESPVNFSVLINGANTNKKKYIYSAKLNRIYVDAECDFSLEFKWDDTPEAPQPAFVRTVVVFHDDEQAERKVETCIQHKSILERNRQMNEVQMCNVLHSSRDNVSDGVSYAGGGDTWHSTIVKFDRNPRSHAYRFICKNSCTGGMNRRAIDILFTLEDIHGKVYGREMVGARVCACPRRDFRKDEESEGLPPNGKRICATKRRDPPEPPKGKKVKLEVVADTEDDERIITLPVLRVRGVHTALAGCEVMIKMMEQHKRLSSDPKTVTADEEMLSLFRTAVDCIKNNSH